MNLESLKAGFLAYLSEKYQNEGDDEKAKQVFQPGFGTIFQNFSLFKEYLSKELGNVKGLDTISIADLDKLDLKDGKLVDVSEEQDSSTEMLNDFFVDKKIKNNNKTENIEKNNADIENPVKIDDPETPVSIDSILADKNIAAIFSLNSESEELTEDEKEMASSFISSLAGGKEINKDSLDALLKLFDSDGDGIISEEDSKNAREMLSVLSGDNELSKEDFEIFNEFSKSIFESDKEMTGEGFIDFIKNLDGDDSKLTADDFKKIREYQGLGITPSTLENQKAIEAGTPSDQSPFQTPETQAGISPDGPNGNPNGNSYSPSDGGGVQPSGGKRVSSPASKDKDVSNLSIDELEKELESAKQAQTDAENKYNAGVEQADKELSDKIKNLQTDIDKKQQEIDDNDSKITTQEATVQNSENAVAAADKKITDLEKAISDYTEPTEADFTTIGEDGEPVVDKEGLAAKKAECAKAKAKLEEDLESAKEEKRKAEEKLTKDKQDLEDLKTNKTTLSQELETYNTTMKGYETEVENLTSSNETLKSLKDAVDKSKEYVKTVESTLERRKADRTKKENGEKLPLTYNLNGKEYHCVGIQGMDTDGDGKNDVEFDSFEQFQRYMAQGGVANVGKYGTMQCFNYSQQYGEVIMGVADSRFTSALAAETQGLQGDADTAGKMATQSEYNKRNFAQVKSRNRDEEYEVIKNELQNGRPCVVSVPYTGGCHYAIAIGMSDDGDVLIMDSYDCSIQRLGRTRNNDNNSERRNLSTANGVWIYMPNYSFSYSDKRGIDYNFFKANGHAATLSQILQNRA